MRTTGKGQSLVFGGDLVELRHRVLVSVLTKALEAFLQKRAGTVSKRRILEQAESPLCVVT